MYSSFIPSATQTSCHPSVHKAIYPISHLSNRHQPIHPSYYQVSLHPFIRRAIIHPLIHPTNHTAAICKLIVNPFTHPNILSSIHPQSYLSNQSYIQAVSSYPSLQLFSQLDIHSSDKPFFIQPSIQQQSMYSSSILSVTQTSYHPSIHKAIYPISHPSNRHQSIHPSNYQVSRRALHSTSHYSSIDPSNQP